MTDTLIERLRRRRPRDAFGYEKPHNPDGDAAADEIERLSLVLEEIADARWPDVVGVRAFARFALTASCDRNPEGGDGTAPSRSDESAVGEAETPNPKSLRAQERANGR